MKPDFISALLQEWGAILFGLAVGALAHFGRKLMVGIRPSAPQVFGYLMQLGVIGLVASVSTRLLSITNQDMRALATAILAISAQEVLQALKRQGWRPFTQATFGAPADIGPPAIIDEEGETG